MLIWRLSLQKYNYRMAQPTNWVPAILDYMKKAKSNISTSHPIELCYEYYDNNYVVSIDTDGLCRQSVTNRLWTLTHHVISKYVDATYYAMLHTGARPGYNYDWGQSLLVLMTVSSESTMDCEYKVHHSSDVATKNELHAFDDETAAILEVESGSGAIAELFLSKKFNFFDKVMAVVDRLKASNHPLRVFNSQTVDECDGKM